MVSTLGFALLLLVFSIGIFLPFFIFFSCKKTRIAEVEKISSMLVIAIFIAAILSQICLIYSFVISDYSVANVYKNSHHLKPLIYKISGSWGNHEGSMLLLILVICSYTLAFTFLSKISTEKKLITISSQSLIIALFAAFTAFTSNPFERIFPTPISGLGLNPLLQDIGLALHPPMLYAGYVGFSLIFSFVMAGLLCEKIDREFCKEIRPWLFLSYGFLTLGIGLGSWWAYRELGWGGYWFWDPVENISLMPWLAATALIHILKLVEKKEIFKNLAAFLGILTFTLCLIGIFLTRSGVLTSVHAFAIDTSRGFFILALILLISGSGLAIFGAKTGKIKNAAQPPQSILKSKSWLILVNNYFLLIALFIVFLGTLYPIFSSGFLNQFVTLGPDYYNRVFSILIIPFLIFLLIATPVAVRNLSRLPAILAHLGFIFIILGIIITSFFGLTKERNLRQGEAFNLGGYEIKFEKIEYLAGKNFLARQGDFSVMKNGDKIDELRPQLRYYPINDQTTNEAAILHGIFDDLYLVIGNKDEDENYALRAYYKPFIWLIWSGCFLIFLSAFLKVLDTVS